MIISPIKNEVFMCQKFCFREIGFAFKLSGEGMYKNNEPAYKRAVNKNNNTRKT
jgi:hypothetical protein